MGISYSTLFTTIYDETSPIGGLGRGTHYSILRSTESSDVFIKPIDHFKVHDFAVVWDEDHDKRVTDVIEQLYINKVLSPVLFIGERKGHLTVIVDKDFYDQEAAVTYLKSSLEDVFDKTPDPWSFEVGYFDKQSKTLCADSVGIIQAPSDEVSTYLTNINNLWKLGLKDYSAISNGQ